MLSAVNVRRLFCAAAVLCIAGAANAVTVVFQQGVNGYNGTMDKELVSIDRNKPGVSDGTLLAMEG
jgi:hypothetical protein